MPIPNTGLSQAGRHILSDILRSSSTSGSRQGSEAGEARASMTTSSERIHGHGTRAGSLEQRSRQFSHHNLSGNHTTAAPAERETAEAGGHRTRLFGLGISLDGHGHLPPDEAYIRDGARMREPHSPGTSPQYDYPVPLARAAYCHPLRRTALMMTPMAAGLMHRGTGAMGQRMGERGEHPNAPFLASRPHFTRRNSTTSASTLLRAPHLACIPRFELDVLYS